MIDSVAQCTRIKRGTTVTITNAWYADGVIVDPGVVTIGIVRDSGASLVAAGTATTGTGATVRSFTLTTTHTAALDILTATWTSPTQGADEAKVEIRGDYLFSFADARRVKPLDNVTTYPADILAAGRTLAETALEEACEVAFVPTYFRHRLDGRGKTDLMLPVSRPLTVTAATIDGTALSVGELAALELYDDGRVYREAGWSSGRRNVVITGTHGYAFPPPRVGHAAIRLTKWALVDQPGSDRATSMTTEDGTTQFLVTGGTRQAVFDLPQANAVVDLYGLRDALTVA